MNDQTILSSGGSSARLLVEEGILTGQQFTLSQDEAVFGRDSDLALTIQDPEISRRHARIRWQQGEYVLEDLGSTNGTMLNGVQIREPHVLKNGDRIGVGQTLLLFTSEAAPQPQPATYTPPPIEEPATFQGPPAQAAPPPAAAPVKKKSNCLLYGCGCLVILGLLLAILIVLALLVFPNEIQPFLNEYGVPIQLVMSTLSPVSLVV
jgi:hypothetical protein